MHKFLNHFVAVFIIASSLFAQDSKTLSGFYSGILSKNLPITISLFQSGNEVNGYYHYDKSNSDIRLHGKINSSGMVDLEEYGYFEITGFWNGNLIGDQFKGSWTSGDKKRSLPFLCKKIEMKSSAGLPMKSKIAFGAVEITLKSNHVTVPKELAKKLFNELIESGEIDTENEYTKDVIKKGKENPSVLFVGESVDLNNDNVSELLVSPSGSEGACTSQNCLFWIFRKNKSDYQQILAGSAGIYGYKVLNDKGNGFYDITLIQHSSAVEHEFEVYRFNGNEYKLMNCITETAHEGKNGNVIFTYNEHNCNN